MKLDRVGRCFAKITSTITGIIDGIIIGELHCRFSNNLPVYEDMVAIVIVWTIFALFLFFAGWLSEEEE